MAKNFVSNKDETARMFKNDFIESMSRVHWTVPLIIYTPVVIYFIYASLVNYHVEVVELFFLLAFGFFIWTLVEYVLHRFLFHYHPKSELGKRIHWMFHGVHHDYPSDSKRLVMVPSVSIPLAFLFYYIYTLILSEAYAYPIFAGFVMGYLFYDTTHYAIHHFGIRNKFFLSIKQHHMRHHFQDPDHGFGVSQPIWDYVFNTTFKK